MENNLYELNIQLQQLEAKIKREKITLITMPEYSEKEMAEFSKLKETWIINRQNDKEKSTLVSKIEAMEKQKELVMQLVAKKKTLQKQIYRIRNRELLTTQSK